MKKKMLVAVVLALVLFVLVSPILSPRTAEAACPSPGTGYAGALNMLNDAKMWDTMYAHVPPQGWAGMFTAVTNSACGHP
jgi:hypothetical protein